jgi:hypothetical protein
VNHLRRMHLRYTVLIVSPDGKRYSVASRHTDIGDAWRGYSTQGAGNAVAEQHIANQPITLWAIVSPDGWIKSVGESEFAAWHDYLMGDSGLPFNADLQSQYELAGFQAVQLTCTPVKTNPMTERDAAVINAAEKMLATADALDRPVYQNGNVVLWECLMALAYQDSPSIHRAAAPALAAIRAARDELRAALDKPPNLVEAFRKLREATGGAWDNVDAEAFVREQRGD